MLSSRHLFSQTSQYQEAHGKALRCRRQRRRRCESIQIATARPGDHEARRQDRRLGRGSRIKTYTHGSSVMTPQFDIVRVVEKIDYRIKEEGSLVLIWPVSDEATSWCSEHLPEDCPRFGSAYAIESRYAFDITVGMAEDGLVGWLA